MKTYLTGLQSSTQTTYSPSTTKTSMLGRVNQKTINSQSVMGPGLTGFIDTQTNQAISPGYVCYVPQQNQLWLNVPNPIEISQFLGFPLTFP